MSLTLKANVGGTFQVATEALIAKSRTGPLGAALRGAALVVTAWTIAEVHRHVDPGVLCPLRRMTGIPCPLCGSTTVFLEAGSGKFRAAVIANPVTLVAVIGLIVAPLGLGRRWWRLASRRRELLIWSALGIAWLWQLMRFGFL